MSDSQNRSGMTPVTVCGRPSIPGGLERTSRTTAKPFRRDHIEGCPDEGPKLLLGNSSASHKYGPTSTEDGSSKPTIHSGCRVETLTERPVSAAQHEASVAIRVNLRLGLSP